MPNHVSTYSGGMDRDSSKNKYKNNSYYNMRNFRLISFDELSNGTIHSVKGNVLKLIPPQGYSNHIVIGNKTIRDYHVAWVTDNTSDEGGKGSIWYTKLNNDIPEWVLVIEHEDLKFSTKHPVFEEVIGYYESDDIVKVYWTDNFNMFRSVNLLDPPSSIDKLNILSDVSFEAPEVINIGTGGLYVGKVQYAYQYYDIYGSETTFSPCTPLIHLTESIHLLSGTFSRLYQGSESLDDKGNPRISGKSVTIRIDNIDQHYDMVRVVAIHYRNLNQEPEIHVVGEYNIIDSLRVVDFGVYGKGTISFNAFRTSGNHELYCKTISQKGNKALIGNITEKFFDIDYDARAYRYGPVSGTNLTKALIINLTSITDLDLLNCTNDKLTFDPATPVDVAAYTNDEQGFTGTVTGLRLIYSDPVAFNQITLSGTGTCVGDHVGGYSSTFSYISDTTFRVTIVGFQRFAEIELGVPATHHIIGSITFPDTIYAYIEYNSVHLGHMVVEDTTASAATWVYTHATDTIEINVTSSAGDYFNNFSYFFSDNSYITFRMQYEYDEVIQYTYYTVDTSALNYNPLNVGIQDNPTWDFEVTLASGLFFPMVAVFDAANITDVMIYVNTYFIYSGVSEGRIVVYNTKSGLEEDIHFDGAVWPATNYTMNVDGVFVDVPEDHDCINPYNFDMLYGASLPVPNIVPQIDEVATYCLITDFAINPLTNEPNNANQFKWQSDLVTIGGEGPNVKYEFITEAMLINQSNDTRYTEPGTIQINDFRSYDSYKNPLRDAYLLSLKRDEVYRIGLVAVNSKGQDSFVKWIGDIKTPTVSELPTCENTAPLSRSSEAFALGVKFTINTAPLVDQDVVAIRIVRVERTKRDRSVYGQGIVSNMFIQSHPVATLNGYITAYTRATVKTPTEGTDATYTREPKVVQFISPEITLFKDLNPLTSDYLKLQGKLDIRTTYWSKDYNVPNESIDVFGANERTTAIPSGGTFQTEYNLLWYNYSRYINVSKLNSLLKYDITDGVIAGLVEYRGWESNKITFGTTPGGLNIVNYSADMIGSNLNHGGIAGTCAILVLDENLSLTELTGTDQLELYLVDYKQTSVAASQYGGFTYEARQNNTYIDCGIYFKVTGGVDDIEVYGGDTYIGFFNHLKTMWEAQDLDGNGYYDILLNDRVFAHLSFPCETPINIDLTHGALFDKYYTDYSIYGLREEAGTYDVQNEPVGGNFGLVGPANTRTYLVQEENMYLYNTVYSQQNTSKVFFQKPFNWESVVHEDTLVKISLEKLAKDEIDNYLKFLTDNEKLLPSEFGPVNDLFLYKNYMIVFMDHAFGTLSIDERALLPIQNNSILELGAANNLQYFDFISNLSGCVHPQSIENTENGFIWFDAYSGMMGLYNGETLDIGFIKGMSSEFKNHKSSLTSANGVFHNNQLNGGNVLCAENRQYKETLCAFVVSEMAEFGSNDGANVMLVLNNSPGNYKNAYVIVNGVEYIADSITGPGSGSLVLNTSDNPTMQIVDFNPLTNYLVYYKDLSMVYSLSSVTGAFELEIDIYPTWLNKYKKDLYSTFGKFTIWKENVGNYGEFYGKYRHGFIDYLINPGGSTVCLFNNYEYAMELMDANGSNILGRSWDTVRIFNDYQYSTSTGRLCLFRTGANRVGTDDGLSHNLLVGDRVTFSGSSLPATVDIDKLYYVININIADYQISETRNGVAIVFAADTNGLMHYYDIPLINRSNIRRRIRTWRMKDFRDMKGFVNGNLKPRIRDTHVRVLLKYQHGDNNKLVMHDLNTFFTVTRESSSKF